MIYWVYARVVILWILWLHSSQPRGWCWTESQNSWIMAPNLSWNFHVLYSVDRKYQIDYTGTCKANFWALSTIYQDPCQFLTVIKSALFNRHESHLRQTLLFGPHCPPNTSSLFRLAAVPIRRPWKRMWMQRHAAIVHNGIDWKNKCQQKTRGTITWQPIVSFQVQWNQEPT